MKMVEKNKNSLKALIWTAVIVGGIILAGIANGTFFGTEKLFGKEVVYSNTFINAAHLEVLPNKTLVISNCNKEISTIAVTEDTIILKGNRGTVGLKAVGVDVNGGLHAYSSDSTEFVLIRIQDRETTEDVKKEMLIVIRPGTQYPTVILSHGTECPELK